MSNQNQKHDDPRRIPLGPVTLLSLPATALYGVDVMIIAHTAPPANSPAACPETSRLVMWLRCRVCHRGYFASGAPGPQPCPACAGGRLQPVGLWDLRNEAAPPGMLRRGEV